MNDCRYVAVGPGGLNATKALAFAWYLLRAHEKVQAILPMGAISLSTATAWNGAFDAVAKAVERVKRLLSVSVLPALTEECCSCHRQGVFFRRRWACSQERKFSVRHVDNSWFMQMLLSPYFDRLTNGNDRQPLDALKATKSNIFTDLTVVQCFA